MKVSASYLVHSDRRQNINHRLCSRAFRIFSCEFVNFENHSLDRWFAVPDLIWWWSLEPAQCVESFPCVRWSFGAAHHFHRTQMRRAHLFAVVFAWNTFLYTFVAVISPMSTHLAVLSGGNSWTFKFHSECWKSRHCHFTSCTIATHCVQIGIEYSGRWFHARISLIMRPICSTFNAKMKCAAP